MIRQPAVAQQFRTCGSRYIGTAALPHKNIQQKHLVSDLVTPHLIGRCVV